MKKESLKNLINYPDFVISSVVFTKIPIVEVSFRAN